MVCDNCEKFFKRVQVNGQTKNQRFCSRLCQAEAFRRFKPQEKQSMILGIKIVSYMTGIPQRKIPDEIVRLSAVYVRVKARLAKLGVIV